MDASGILHPQDASGIHHSTDASGILHPQEEKPTLVLPTEAVAEPKPVIHQVRSYLQKHIPQSDTAITPLTPFKATQLTQLYKFPPPPSTPITISVISFGGGIFGTVSASGVVTSGDIQAYWTSLGIPTAKQPKVILQLVDGGTNTPVRGQAETAENTIDVSIIGACCATPSLTILLFIGPNSTNEFQPMIEKATSPNTIDGVVYTPSVLSISWGAAELYYTQAQVSGINTALQNASKRGVNVCASTGDYGSSDGVAGGTNNVDFPGSSPFVTACGGTTLTCPTFNYSDPTTVEIAWSKGGGGVSSMIPKPAWQTIATQTNRCIPDIALNADPATGIQCIVGGSNVIYGGTSVVSPMMAAYYACLNTNTFLLPSLYSASAAAPSSFHDITVGTNGSYKAAVGYDLCTGLGSIAGDLLAVQLKGSPPPPPTTVPVTGLTLNTSSASIDVGQQYSIVATVQPTNATNKAITWTSKNPSIATVVPIGCSSGSALRCECAEGCACGCVVGSVCRCVDPSCIAPPKPAVTACDSVGLVTGIATGTTQIVATTADGNFTKSVSIQCLQLPTTIPVTGVTVQPTLFSLLVGGHQQLVATVTPTNATNPSVGWTSSNSSVATVDSTGLVTAVATGSASILVTTVEGGFTAQATATIVPLLKRIAFYPPYIQLYTNSSFQSTLVFNPPSASTLPIVYTSNSSSIASVNSTGLVTGIHPGITTICATAGGKTAYLNVYVFDPYSYYASRSSIPPIRKSGTPPSYTNSYTTFRR